MIILTQFLRKKWIHQATLLILIILCQPKSIYAQNIQLFNHIDNPQTEWAGKQVADLRQAEIQVHEPVLNQIRDGHISEFGIIGFNGTEYTIEVRRVIHQLDGDWSVIGWINGNWKDSFILSYSNDKVLSTIREVTDHNFMEIRYDDDFSNHLLIEIDPHEREELDCGQDHELVAPSGTSQNLSPENFEPSLNNSTVIDVMVVYTPSSESWANFNSSGIRNVINQAMAIAQNSVDNSRINIVFRLVHIAKVSYNETGNSSTDLRNLTFGRISNVHNLRNQFGADLVSMFTNTNDVGGIAWLMDFEGGHSDYGYSISRVQQVAWTSTHAHEMGHNLGNEHSRNQFSGRAPASGGVYTFSTGWRWIGTNGRSYASVMTYRQNSTMVDIFSNPNITYAGSPTGSYSGPYSPADNARSMERMKSVIAGYMPTRVVTRSPTVTTNHVTNISFRSARAGGNVTSSGGSDVTSRGICWGRNQNPGLNDQCRNSGSGTGNYNINMDNLSPYTNYYVRAFASNSVGTSYGDQRSFRTLEILVDANNSSLTSSKSEVEANGEQVVEIKVIARDMNNDPVSDVTIRLSDGLAGTMIDETEKNTNQYGEVIFQVQSLITGIVEFQAFAVQQSATVPIDQKAIVAFIPVAPVALAASNVNTQSITANWEVVSGADSYELDVSTDSSFVSMVPGYTSIETGNVTSYEVTTLSAGTDYHYRVRAKIGDLTGAFSETISTITYPEVPVATTASDQNALQFMANWQLTDGARKYLLDVAYDEDFESILPDYHALEVGSQTSFEILHLQPGTDYFYRIRSQAGFRISDYSNVIQTSTLYISAENSIIEQQQLRILANGQQTNPVQVYVKSDEGVPLRNLRVNLEPESGQPIIKALEPVTNIDGVADFALSNLVAEVINFRVMAHESLIGTFSVEFLANEGIVALGNNYPNPFRDVTTLPVTVPQQMMIRIVVYDTLGKPVLNVAGKEMETGYYEIPVHARGLASGLYFYRLYTEEKILTESMMLIR